MKLIYCRKCSDIVSLQPYLKFCACSKSWGYYKKDELDVVINKWAIPIGFNNISLEKALRRRPKHGKGKNFEAFVIPFECARVEVSEVDLELRMKEIYKLVDKDKMLEARVEIDVLGETYGDFPALVGMKSFLTMMEGE